MLPATRRCTPAAVRVAARVRRVSAAAHWCAVRLTRSTNAAWSLPLRPRQRGGGAECAPGGRTRLVADVHAPTAAIALVQLAVQERGSDVPAPMVPTAIHRPTCAVRAEGSWWRLSVVSAGIFRSQSGAHGADQGMARVLSGRSEGEGRDELGARLEAQPGPGHLVAAAQTGANSIPLQMRHAQAMAEVAMHAVRCWAARSHRRVSVFSAWPDTRIEAPTSGPPEREDGVLS